MNDKNYTKKINASNGFNCKKWTLPQCLKTLDIDVWDTLEDLQNKKYDENDPKQKALGKEVVESNINFGYYALYMLFHGAINRLKEIAKENNDKELKSRIVKYRKKWKERFK